MASLTDFELFECYFNLLANLDFDASRHFILKEATCDARSSLGSTPNASSNAGIAGSGASTPPSLSISGRFRGRNFSGTASTMNISGKQPLSIMDSMSNFLAQLSMAEKNYHNLNFVSPKGLFNKESSLRMTFETLKSNFATLESRIHLRSPSWFPASQNKNPSSSSIPVPSSEYPPSVASSSTAGTVIDSVDICDSPSESLKSEKPAPSSSNPKSRKGSTASSFFGSLFGSFRENHFDRSGQQRSSTPLPPNQHSRKSPSPSGQSISSQSAMRLALPKDSSSVPGTPTVTTPAESNRDGLAAHLCGQLFHYCRARAELISIYEGLHKKAVCVDPDSPAVVDDLISHLYDVMRLSNKFHHPALGQLESSFSSECDVLLGLFKTWVFIQNYCYLPAVFALHDAACKLSSWISSTTLPISSPVNGAGLSGILSSSTSNSITNSKSKQPSKLMIFLREFKSQLLEKMCLYFNEVMNKWSTTQNQIKEVTTRLQCDYVRMIANFQRKSGFLACLIVYEDGLDSSDSLYSITGYSSFYRSQGSPFEGRPQGLDTFPVVFRWPASIQVESMHPGIVMNIMNRESYFYDQKMDRTYFNCLIEPRMVLVLIYDGERPEKDREINSFITEMIKQLRRVGTGLNFKF